MPVTRQPRVSGPRQKKIVVPVAPMTVIILQFMIKPASRLHLSRPVMMRGNPPGMTENVLWAVVQSSKRIIKKQPGGTIPAAHRMKVLQKEWFRHPASSKKRQKISVKSAKRRQSKSAVEKRPNRPEQEKRPNRPAVEKPRNRSAPAKKQHLQ